jgi:hypothetical protein
MWGLRESARLLCGLDIAADVVPFRVADFLEDRAVPGTLPHEVACDGATV